MTDKLYYPVNENTADSGLQCWQCELYSSPGQIYYKCIAGCPDIIFCEQCKPDLSNNEWPGRTCLGRAEPNGHPCPACGLSIRPIVQPVNNINNIWSYSWISMCAKDK